MVKKWDLWLADLNPVFGTEPGKIRPVLIIQSDALNDEGALSTVVLSCTSKIKEGLHFLRYKLDPKLNNGLDKPTDVLLSQFRSIDNKRLKIRLGSITDTQAEDISYRIKIVLDLE
jgi:mRNA interferase MazF